MPGIIENEGCGSVTCVTAALGGAVGLSSLIYYSVTVIQPKIAKTRGMNKTESDLIAAIFCLSGVALVVGVSVAAGACIGGSTNYFYEAAKSCSDNCYGFFSNMRNTKINVTPLVRHPEHARDLLQGSRI
ncbi:MAG: hypothetical protein P1U61_06780 [Legionellaceae bacterium]|nr:hypothetical protein [Legionellaceae bacterium]